MLCSRNARIASSIAAPQAVANHDRLCRRLCHLGIDLSRDPAGGGDDSAILDGRFQGNRSGCHPVRMGTMAWGREPEFSHWRGATIVGGLLLLGGNGLLSWAQQRVPSGVSALIIGSVPLWMILLEWLWHRGPRPTLGIVSGLIVGFPGLGFLVGPGRRSNGAVINLSDAVVLLLAAFLWAAGSLYSRRARLPSSQLQAAAMEMLTGGALLMLAGGVTGEWTRFAPAHVSAHSWVAWVYLVTFGSLIGFTAYVWLLQVASPAHVSTYAYVNPVVAVFLGWALAGEQVTSRTLLAAAAIILAVVIIVTRSAEAPTEV